MEPNVQTYLFTQGILGISTLVLGFVCIKLYNKTEKQEQRIQDLLDLRLQDSIKVQDNMSELIRGSTEANRIIAEKIETYRGRR